jgi:carbon monoxide dehydrogenase subunit G
LKISQTFVVEKPLDIIWDFFQDVPSVAQCLPGAQLQDRDDDGTYSGSLSVKLGPMTSLFEGKATIEPDPASLSAIIEGKGVDKKGGSRGQVKVEYRITGTGQGSEVSVDADIHLSGPAAQFGRTGLINEMSKRLIREFVDCLEAKLGAENTEQAGAIEVTDVRGIGLFFASLWAWLKRLFGGSRD